MGGWTGQVAGRIGWRAGSGGGPVDWRGMDLQSKECSGVNKIQSKECSGVNKVT